MQQDISIQITEGNYIDATAHYEVDQFEGEPVHHTLYYIDVELFGMGMEFTEGQLSNEAKLEIIKQIELAENEQ